VSRRKGRKQKLIKPKHLIYLNAYVRLGLITYTPIYGSSHEYKSKYGAFRLVLINNTKRQLVAYIDNYKEEYSLDFSTHYKAIQKFIELISQGDTK
jgi:hypothetical protein